MGLMGACHPSNLKNSAEHGKRGLRKTWTP
jgi:hypothetical protein